MQQYLMKNMAAQQQLDFRIKIIELQKSVEFEKNRADNFKTKYQQLLRARHTDSSQWIEKLAKEQQQNQQLRFKLLQIKKTQHNSKDQLQLSQNQHYDKILETLKEAALAIINDKAIQIGELTECRNKLLHELAESKQKYQQIFQAYQNILSSLSSQQKQFTNRQNSIKQQFISKLDTVQKLVNQGQLFKQHILQQNTQLENYLKENQQMFRKYHEHIAYLGNAIQQQKQHTKKIKEAYSAQLIQLTQLLKYGDKQINKLSDEKKILNQQIKQAQITIERLTLQNRELLETKMNQHVKYQNEKFSFIGEMPKNIQQTKNLFSSIMRGQSILMDPEDMQRETLGFQFRQINHKQRKQSKQSFNGYAEIVEEEQQQKKNDFDAERNKYLEQISKLQNTISELKLQIKQYQQERNQNIAELEKVQIELNTKLIENTKLRELNQQLHLQSQPSAQLLIELQTLKQFVNKLQNALLIEKLQHAQKQQYHKQRIKAFIKEWDQRQTQFQQKIQQLSLQLSQKTKKGFFNW